MYAHDNYDDFLSSLNIDDTQNDSDIDFESCYSDESDIDIFNIDQNKEPENTLASQLRYWYSESRSITREAMAKLLKILRINGHEDLPTDARTLLKTPRKTCISTCEPGEYFHYGISVSMCNILPHIAHHYFLVYDMLERRWPVE